MEREALAINSFQAPLENEILDMVSNEIGAIHPHMDNILYWNIRGLNGLNKKEDISLVISKHSIGLAGLLETKVKAHNISKVANANALQGWQCYYNIQQADKDRIWVVLETQ